MAVLQFPSLPCKGRAGLRARPWRLRLGVGGCRWYWRRTRWTVLVGNFLLVLGAGGMSCAAASQEFDFDLITFQ